MKNTAFSKRQFLQLSTASLCAAVLPVYARAEKICQPSMGTVCLKQPAKRIICLDDRHIENIVALNMQPVAVAAAANYRHIMANVTPALDSNVTDIGLATSPNIELMMSQQPDLILGNDRVIKKNQSILTSICPVAMFNPYPANHPDLYSNMLTTFKQVAELTNKQTVANQVIQDLETDIITTKQQLAKAGWANRPVVLGNINTGITGADVMLFNKNAMPAQILERLGLKYQLNSPQLINQSFQVTTVEALIAIQDAHFLYMPFNEAGVKKLMNTPVWRNLNFVKQKHFYSLTYYEMYGGPLSAKAFIQQVKRALLS